MSHRESSYVISNDVRGRHYESCIVQHDVSRSHIELRTVWAEHTRMKRREKEIDGVRKMKLCPLLGS